VTKQIACVVSNNTCGVYSGSAIGFTSATQTSAFCYTINVINCGQVNLTGVVVTDTVFGVLGTIPSFPSGATTNFTFMTELAHDTTNVVTAMGTTVGTLSNVSACASATGFVLQASISCTKTAAPSTFGCGSGPHPVTYSVLVTNTGEADLAHVTISDPTLSSNGCVLPLPFSLGAGDATNLTLCTVTVDCGTGGGGSNDCANPLLGQAADTTVLQLGGGHSVSITGPAGGILGDISIGPNSKLSLTGSEFVNGDIRLAPGATFSDSSSGSIGAVLHNVDLTPEINAALNTYNSAKNQPCTQTINTLSQGTITGVAGLNVICVKNVNINGGHVVTITGPASATFIFNVTGQFTINGGGSADGIQVSGGVTRNHVLYNIIGTGQQVSMTGGGGGTGCCVARIDGTLLAPFRNIALSPGLVNGEIIGGLDISIVSGSSVRCTPSTCVPVTVSNTLTVSGEVAEIQAGNVTTCARDQFGNPITASSTCTTTVDCQ